MNSWHSDDLRSVHLGSVFVAFALTLIGCTSQTPTPSGRPSIPTLTNEDVAGKWSINGDEENVMTFAPTSEPGAQDSGTLTIVDHGREIVNTPYRLALIEDKNIVVLGENVQYKIEARSSDALTLSSPDSTLHLRRLIP